MKIRLALQDTRHRQVDDRPFTSPVQRYAPGDHAIEESDDESPGFVQLSSGPCGCGGGLPPPELPGRSRAASSGVTTATTSKRSWERAGIEVANHAGQVGPSYWLARDESGEAASAHGEIKHATHLVVLFLL